MSPTLILLAGPNGAGKSTLYQTRVAPVFAGPFINADMIQREELGDVSPEAAYRAADIATQRRSAILSKGGDFATETVFSHPSKLDLVTEARALGYTVWVMHVGVDSPDLSVARVAHRVGAGGHGVPETKIRERYDRSAPLIREAVHLADTGLVFDNSVAGQPPKLVLTFERGLLIRVRSNLPLWIGRTYAADVVGANTIGETE
jgi:predicted ABC-type ATPase